MNSKRLLAFVGTWQTFAGKGDGIHVYQVDPATGAFLPLSHHATRANTSMLCVADDGRFVYAVDERKDLGGVYGMGGGVVSYAFDKDSGRLTCLGGQPSLGSCPAFVQADPSGSWVLVANHGTRQNNATTVVSREDGGYGIHIVPDDSSTVLFPVREGQLDPACDVKVYRGGGASSRAPHCHSVTFDPTGRWALCCDKGMDRIFVYSIQDGRLVESIHSPYRCRPGSFPRHLAFHPVLPMFFTSNEYEYSLSSYSFDRESGEIRELDFSPTQRDGIAATPRYPGTVDVRVHPNGRFLYVSNRATNSGITGFSPEPDGLDSASISVFQLEGPSGKLIPVAEQAISCGNPRSFCMSPDGRWLYVAELDENRIAKYPVNPENGLLGEGKQIATVPSPSCIRLHRESL